MISPGSEQLRRLTEISRALTYTTSLEQVTRLTVERSAELLGARAAVLMLPDGVGLLHVRAAVGVEDSLVTRFRAPQDDGLMERLQGLLGAAESEMIAVPLVVGGAVTGFVAVVTGSSVTTADEWLLSAVADQAAVALENARLGGEVRIEMEERLRVSEDATSAKDHALSTLAHDIRTPLGAIEGYCGILEAEILGGINDRQRETLGRIRLSGRHLLSLLDNVMDMARLNAGVMELGANPVRLVEVAREAVHLLIPSAEARFQSIVIVDEADVIVAADHDRLRQVLVNLIGNAVKFTPHDGVITVTTCASDDGTAGEIRVLDTGPGIADEEREAIFQPYYRSDVTARAPGVGLGLAISHGLVTQMSGELAVQSEPGAGATFIVRLPLVAQ